MESENHAACKQSSNISTFTKRSQAPVCSKPFAAFPAGSRSHSPHFSPDRITRHASPSRLELAQKEVSIVPRIPQPYRTSFSAVTAPLRIPKDISSDLMTPSSSINLLGVRRRTTSPGRIKPFTHQKISETMKAQCSSSADVLYSSCEITELKRNEPVNSVQGSSPSIANCDIKSTVPLLPCLDSETRCSEISKTALGQTGDIINGTNDITAVCDEKLLANQTTSELCMDQNSAGEEFKPAKQSEHRRFFGKFKSLRSDRGPVVSRSRGVSPNCGLNPSGNKTNGDGIESESNEIRCRSKTMPSQAVVSENGLNVSRNPKSLSMSITSFLKKMSPKSLRRFGGLTAKPVQSNQEATASTDSLVELSEMGSGSTSLSRGGTSGDSFTPDTSGLSDSYMPATTSAETTRSSRSLKKTSRMPSVKRLFTSRSKQRDGEKRAEKSETGNTNPGKAELVSGQSLTPEMTLMLKSIEDSSVKTHHKSIYQTFKDKRSPVRASEPALGLKPQLLQTVEFPDDLLHRELSNANGSNLNLGLSSSVNGGLQDGSAAAASCRIGDAGACIASPSRQISEPSGKRRDPPRTLNIQSVHMIGKRAFHFPSMSVESIGQCSLDVADVGSEASLVQNGHFSSVSASKRTLNSQDNIVDSAAKSSLPVSDSCGCSLTGVDDPVYGASDFSNVEPRAAPSYLKLSRAIGGYTPYNTYTSVTEHEQSRIDNSVGSNKLQPKQHRDSEVILQNGDPVVTIKQPHQTSVYGSTERHSQCILPDKCGDTLAVGHISAGNNFSSSSSSFSVDHITHQNVLPSTAFTGSGSIVCHVVPSLRIVPPVVHEDCPTHVAELHGEGSNQCDLTTKSSSFPPIRADFGDSEPSKKDGNYFLSLVDNAETHLKSLCDRTEMDLQSKTSDEEEGRMRAAVGKANLLILKKFPQFRQLCRANLNPKEDDPFKTTEQDLSGFWDMVLIQVEDIGRQFEEIEQLRKVGWTEIKPSQEIRPESSTVAVKPSATRTKTTKSNSTTNTRSPASTAAAKAREEARKRLMAAKAAGRQRKASESDKDIEIFVS